MILVRTIFHAHRGKINQLVEGFKQTTHDTPEQPMILTDLSGPIDTVVLAGRHESLAADEQWRAQLFKSQQFQESQATVDNLIESSSIKFYTIEQA